MSVGGWLRVGLSVSMALLGLSCRAAEPSDATASSHPGLLARLPDGRKLNFRCSGVGGPTVILEGGWAATSLAWDGVRARIAARHKVCAYDRAGSGFSDPGPEPRDGAAIARDLDDGLRAARLHGPFVLVGHSAGALYIRLFANRRPTDVAGFVFVDPSVEFQDRRLADRFGPGAGSVAGSRLRAETCLAAAEAGALPSTEPRLALCVPKDNPAMPALVNAARRREALRPATWRAQVSELDTLWTSTSEDISRERSTYGDTPLIVLTAAGTQDSAPEPVRSVAQAFWTQLHQELAAKSRRGRQISVERSSHLMMKDRPDAIVSAVETVAEEARTAAVNRPTDETRK